MHQYHSVSNSFVLKTLFKVQGLSAYLTMTYSIAHIEHNITLSCTKESLIQAKLAMIMSKYTKTLEE